MSRNDSPLPLRQQLAALPLNQERSFSRVKSNSLPFTGDSIALSPLPFFPRRRSVRFAPLDRFKGDEGLDADFEPCVREERPVCSAPNSRQTSPVPSFTSRRHDDSGAGSRHGSRSPKPAAAVGPGRRRTRSASRQRLAIRRRDAQLHHSFYDDSFVEDFVRDTRAELEREAAERRRAEEQRRAEERAKRAGERAAVEEANLRAIYQAKETLLAAVERRSRTPPRAPPASSSRSSGVAVARRVGRRDEDSRLLRSLEDDPDPKVQEALRQLEQLQPPTSRVSMPLVSEESSAKATRRAASGRRVEASTSRKRAKLEGIVERILSAQAHRRSKQSVVVINWSGEDEADSVSDDSLRSSAGAKDDEDPEEEEEFEPAQRVGAKRRRADRGAGVAPAAARRGRGPSVPLASSEQAMLVGRRRGTPPHRSAGRSQSKGRKGTSASLSRREMSVVPDLSDSEGSAAEDEWKEPQRPVQLPRRRPVDPFLPPPLVAAPPQDADWGREAEETDPLLNGSLDGPRGGGRRGRRRPTASALPGMPALLRRAASNSFSRGVTPVPPADPDPDDFFSNAAPATARQRRNTSRSRSAAPAPHRGADPMDVFFNAAFVSPGQFDALLQNAGGLTTGRGKRNNHQPNLALPASIARKH